MNKKQYFFGIIIASVMGGVIALGGYQLIKGDQPTPLMHTNNQPLQLSSYDTATAKAMLGESMSFVKAAKDVTPGVVHIISTFNSESSSRNNAFDDYFQQFFGPQGGGRHESRPSIGTGSGVIITQDGYIATNNHVVANASDIEVLLDDNRTYKAEVIGTDPTTDLALIKIKGKGLPFVRMGNSDLVEVGEWVLAIGNPFGFRSTVTAGIISAKGRNINILRTKQNNGLSIESFLQTDAAVNPGNSGGALVNLNGELIGINTAIATPTGTYAGYSFAVPATLANKVLADLKEFGVVQRALLGVNIRDVNAELANEEDLTVLEGVYITNVNPSSGAAEAGMEAGDVIIAINGKSVTKTSELQEKVALNRPGDKVTILLLRGGKEKTMNVTLKNTLNTTAAIASSNNMTIQGGEFVDLTDEEKTKYRLNGGAKLTKVSSGKWKEAGIQEGFIITSIDKQPVRSVEDLSRALSQLSGGAGLLIQGVYPNGQKAYYGIGW